MPECCRKHKNVQTVQGDDYFESSEDEEYFHTINIETVEENKDPPIIVQASVDNKTVSFKIDTGADITCIPEKTYIDQFRNKQLFVSKSKIKHAGQKQLTCLGVMRVDIRIKNTQAREEGS